MDTEKCAALVKAVELGSITGAAQALGYTPSGASRMLASLERELGFPLLSRSVAGVVPTPDCERMLPLLRELASLGEACRQEAASVCGVETGTVRVGCAYRLLYGPLVRAIAAFSRLHPAVRVDIVQANSSPLARSLEAREADLCVMSRRSSPCAWEPLLTDSMAVAVPLGHPLAGAASYPVARLAEEPFIEVSPGEESDHSMALAACGVRPEARYAAQDAGAALELVAAGLGVTLLDRMNTLERPGGYVLLPCEPPVTVEIGVAAPPPGQPRPPAARAFEAFAVPALKEEAARLG